MAIFKNKGTHSATRWWSAPMRFTADTLARLRNSATLPRAEVGGQWLKQTPVGIRTLGAQP